MTPLSQRTGTNTTAICMPTNTSLAASRPRENTTNNCALILPRNNTFFHLQGATYAQGHKERARGGLHHGMQPYRNWLSLMEHLLRSHSLRNTTNNCALISPANPYRPPKASPRSREGLFFCVFFSQQYSFPYRNWLSLMEHPLPFHCLRNATNNCQSRTDLTNKPFLIDLHVATYV